MVTTALTALLAVGTASADPPKNKSARIFTFVCGGNEVTFVTIERNRAVVANVVDSTNNFVVREVTFMIIDPDTDEIQFVDTLSVGRGNQAGLQGDLVTCGALEETFVDPESGETITFVASAEVFFTPREGSGNFLVRHLRAGAAKSPGPSLCSYSPKCLKSTF